MDQVVYDGTKKYVYFLYANLWIDLEAYRIRSNLFYFLCNHHETNYKIGMVTWKKG